MSVVTALLAAIVVVAVLVYTAHVLLGALAMFAGAGVAATAALLAFLVGFAIGTAAFRLAGGVFGGDVDNWEAAGTALLAAIAFGALAWIPLVGPVLGLATWLAAINWRTAGSWVNATLVGSLAWVLSAPVSWILGLLSVPVNVVGVPFV